MVAGGAVSESRLRIHRGSSVRDQLFTLLENLAIARTDEQRRFHPYPMPEQLHTTAYSYAYLFVRTSSSAIVNFHEVFKASTRPA
eukprot:scaffold215824_cov33-Tisochrysis_lutea.AAC.2